MGARKASKKAGERSVGFTAEEKAAMKDRAKEVRAEARAGRNREDGEKAVAEAIGQMEGHDRSMAARLHDIVTSSAPELVPRTWYGMPAYANADGKVICFFQAAGKFKVRYATLGFQPDAMLDDGDSWPTAFALARLTPEVEERIVALVRKACG